MTKCNRNNIEFSSLGRKKIIADFEGGNITSDAGGLLLREAEQQIALIDAIDRAIPDPRNPRFILHQQKHMLTQRIFAMAIRI